MSENDSVCLFGPAGTLVEDGLLNLRLKADIAQVLQVCFSATPEEFCTRTQAERYEEAMQALKSFKIDELFICPQISWRPKSEAISTIARELNIGTDRSLWWTTHNLSWSR